MFGNEFTKERSLWSFSGVHVASGVRGLGMRQRIIGLGYSERFRGRFSLGFSSVCIPPAGKRFLIVPYHFFCLLFSAPSSALSSPSMVQKALKWFKGLYLPSKVWIVTGLIHALSILAMAIVMFSLSFTDSVKEDDKQRIRCYAIIFFTTVFFHIFYLFEGMYQENILELLAFITTGVVTLSFAIYRVALSNVGTTVDVYILLGVSSIATIMYIVLAIFVFREFGWFVYKTVSADTKLQKIYWNLTFFRTFLKLDLYLHMMLVCIGLFFYQEAEWEYYVITGGALFLIVWTVLGLLVMRYEKRALAIVWLLFGLVTPPYITLKMIDIIEGHPNAPIVQSLLIAIGAAALRICVFVTGIRCVVFFHRGIKDILDERSARSKQKGPKFVGRLRTADKELTATDNPIGPNGEHTGTSIV
eukprot:gnl/Trimastix_PCT/1292.p1 GENE.gnl/Trimastix_PCT/1292~~gnl/Trimastix_PCT/1292.p1  ORF type:complete len:416 (+),score=94.60 gnl/Trimastix_PCT/1292:410-1657(+)